MIKQSINKYLGKIGYQIRKSESIDRDIKCGKYNWLISRNINSVLDIGANIGNFSLFIKKILPHSSIYAFEPLKECYLQLIDNTRNLDNVKCYNFALGEDISSSTIYHSQFAPSSSILPMDDMHKQAFPHSKESSIEKIEINTLNNFFQTNEITTPILMKIDVQGYEKQVLQGAQNVLSLIDIIIVETSFVELYKDQALFDEIYSLMSQNSFKYFGNFDQIKDPNSGLVLQADAIFIKNKEKE